MRTRAGLLVVLLCLVAVAAAHAQGLPSAKPEQVGLSAERLARLTTTLRGDVEKGVIPGAVLLVARHGRIVLFEALGARDPATKVPMTKDGIFRIYSMSKPITSVATMILFEEGKLTLDQPVSKYLPQLGGLKVGVEKADSSGGEPTLDLQPSRRDMTIQDLLRHTSGLTYGFFGTGLVKKAYVDGKVWDDYPTNAELVDRLAKLPLAYQPGTTWDYSHSTDVLGRVIEVVAGTSLLQFEKERILDPLGMKDTGFYVTDRARQDRIVEPFANDRAFGVNANFNDPRLAQKWESGGGGMVSTAVDYARFLQMLLNGGTLEGQPHPRAEDRRLHDLRPPGSCHRHHAALPARPRFRVRPRLRRADGGGGVAVRGLGRRVQLGRRRRDLLLGGPEGEPVRRLHDAVAQAARAVPGVAEGHDLRGDHEAGRQVARAGGVAIMTGHISPLEVARMIRFAVALVALTALVAGPTAAQDKAPPAAAKAPVAIITLEKGGEIVLEFWPKDAPKHVENFVKLVNEKFYDGQRVHRVEPNFVVQFGDPPIQDAADERPQDGQRRPRLHDQGGVQRAAVRAGRARHGRAPTIPTPPAARSTSCWGRRRS